MSEPYEPPNIPRDDKTIKKLIIPRDGNFLFFLDYKAIEVRILAYYASTLLGDDTLTNEFKDDIDPYVVTARGVFNVEDVTDQQRDIAKRLFLSIVYGGGVPTVMAQGMAKTETEARRYIRNFHATRPIIRRLNSHLKGYMETQGGKICIYGGRMLTPESAHKALNTLIQGSAAVIKRDALITVHKNLRNLNFTPGIINEVHDEIILDIPKTVVVRDLQSIARLMIPERINAVVPIRIAVEYSSQSWADKEEAYTW